MPCAKVVLHVMAGHGMDGEFHGTHGSLHEMYERESGVSITFVSFAGKFLDGDRLRQFMKECSTADVVITDAVNHPTGVYTMSDKEIQASMALIVRSVVSANPTVLVLTQLFGGTRETEAHIYADSFVNYTDQRIFEVIRHAAERENSPWVLVYDDARLHREAAYEQLAKFNLRVTGSYERALQMIKCSRFDCVLADFITYPSVELVGGDVCTTQVPLAPMVALLALAEGVECIGIHIDEEHQDHPAAIAMSMLTLEQLIIDATVAVSSDYTLSSTGERVKDWKLLAESLDV